MDPSPRPPIATAPISIVLTARNEAADLEEVIRGWLSVLDELQRPYEIIVVNDGSSDNTAALADALAAQRPQLRVLHHPAPRGLGAALRTGIAEAKHPLLLYTVCNKEYQPADLNRLLEHIDKVDVVTGYRVWRPIPTWRLWLDALYRGFVRLVFGLSKEPLDCWLGTRHYGPRWLARWIFGVRVRDPECLFTLCRRAIFARMPIQTDGDFAPVEILAKANFLACWLAEVPVSWIPPTRAEAPLGKAARKQARREIWLLFHHPDFGPAAVKSDQSITTENTESTEKSAPN
jgi:glycosyltransferase involved in cell wall biosynthesis